MLWRFLKLKKNLFSDRFGAKKRVGRGSNLKLKMKKFLFAGYTLPLT